ncbi:N-acetylmannosamine-6-phosphate 2-epimerase [Lederbergia sp. NSJ-179]|uniref:N-acetylmannosamine-6-phosphate 2-epimerase n=1 Tax=Lederbergia sp. NSJ-179 TaxID=2931402 RepID=UPI001FD131BD|nr:N-acetylmannosamine-6-phosphate 2-epimerase [Lederbergia sp. NSJ-179]MCJ7843106.1 N-acetylmannosamine-6-phosphate 2-epimerase [Lederbergia sp. NSJ-179]
MWNQKGIIVSCQAHEDEPLHGPQFMAQMAVAAKQGGAIGIRANGVADIATIKEHVDLPIIGILKKNYPGYLPMITPTLEDALAVSYAGAQIIAMDCTKSSRPDGRSLKEIIEALREQTDCKVMADISTLEEGQYAFAAGVDYLGTTLCGYTEETKHEDKPAFSLMKQLVQQLPLPVIAEGGIACPEHVERAFEIGVSWVVIGSAITRPQSITKQFVSKVQ